MSVFLYQTYGNLFWLLSEHRFLVRVSYLEIYNEEVRDLLGSDQTSRLEVKERPDTGVYVKDLSAFSVHNADDMDRIMNVGNKNSESSIILSTSMLLLRWLCRRWWSNFDIKSIVKLIKC